MANPKRRRIAVVLDRSGSMYSVKNDAEGGLKVFLADQAKVEATTTVSLYQFDDRFEVVYENTPLADAPDFSLKPRGSTALFDAIGFTIARVGEQIGALPDADKPAVVLIVIQTDGEENASREYTAEAVKKLVTLMESTAGWVFVFLSTQMDAFDVADSVGIQRARTVHYGGDRTEESLSTASGMVARGSRTGDYSFTNDERDATQGGGQT
ncbi:vWA domain-containing protein [Nonomuraea basaltis]|uniref:vWA domain-containing protein n=1 Tax=Nonomuraea basaltis TaxID=2495887 RepID=UPI00110C6D4A|nr:vWA domain-containing protein [Nonomuraea basaltis]TMR89496.1 VWA domain-containing protein [Nonomuraea basaltis]